MRRTIFGISVIPLLAVGFAFSVTTGCAVMKQDSKENFTLVGATKQMHVAGVAGAGSTTIYQFKLYKNLKKDQSSLIPKIDGVKFEMIWIGNKSFSKINMFHTPSKLMDSNNVSLSDTFILEIKHHIADPDMPLGEEVEVEVEVENILPLFKYEGAALIKYTRDGEVFYIEVAEIKKLPTVSYP